MSAAKVTYSDFLRLRELLGLQDDIGGEPDALFFVAIHQSYEIWFKVIVQALESTRDALAADDADSAAYWLRRVGAAEDVLLAQLPALETLSPARFKRVRDGLGSSSGLESVQFREIEFLSGLKDPSYLENIRFDPRDRERLRRRLDEPSLRDAFNDFCERRGTTDLVATTSDESTDPVVLRLIDQLLDHDSRFARWRSAHAVVVERIIGRKHGTGGSSGVDYLRGTTEKRFFPELWEIRAYL
ncbi:tryptophan 2,3-dioxygenase family protein [Streptomyces apocyni]|uniref:tryptophan 2,3-dioxygenase family protein n=1 Tax=Streptomyces apocyni TaxID=2654677 RepID=UPI0012EAFA52|nr:tryptophan 2,3-dioxygenase family protein [Streptomyces apocyni]